MTRFLIMPIAAALALGGCDTVTELAIGSKDAAVKYTVLAVEKTCKTPELVRREILNLSNAALADKKSSARVLAFLDCDGDGAPDIGR